MSTFEPVFIGTTPAGCEWWARRPGKMNPEVYVHRMRKSFRRLWDKHNDRDPQAALEKARKRYRVARQRVERLKGMANRYKGRPDRWTRSRSTWSYPGYAEASEACTAARKELRRLEKRYGSERYDANLTEN